MHRVSRGISTVIGAAMLIMIIVAFTAFIYVSMQRIERLTELSSRVIEKRAEVAGLGSYVRGRAVYDPLTYTLTIYIYCSYPRTLLITSLSVFFDDGNYVVISHRNLTSSIEGVTYSIEVTSPSGTSYTLDSFPIALGLGYRATIELKNIPTTPESVVITLSSSPATAVVHIEVITTTEEMTNVTVVTPWILSHIPTIAREGTVTWFGKIYTPVYDKRNTSAYSYEAIIGTVEGDVEALNTLDGNNITIYPELRAILTLAERPAIIYEDFYTNPLGKTLIAITNGISYSTDGYDPGMAMVSGELSQHPSQAQIAYFNTELPTNQTWYIMAKVVKYCSDNDNDRWLIFPDAYIDHLVNTMLLSDTQANTFYTLGTEEDAGRGRDDVYILLFYDNDWHYVNGDTDALQMDQNTWYTYYAQYDPQSGYMYLGVLDSTGAVLLASIDAVDTTIVARYLGIGAWQCESGFDNIVLSFEDPTYVEVRVPGPGYSVSIYDPWLGKVYSAVSDENGVARINVLEHPIIRNAVIEITTPDGQTFEFNVTEVLGTEGVVVGGDVYVFRIGYVARVGIYLGVSDILRVDYLELYLYGESNQSITLTLYLYNWESKGFDSVYSSSGTVFNVTGLRVGPDYINVANGSISVLLDLFSDSVYELELDELRFIVAGWYRGEAGDAIVIGIGGTPLVEIQWIGKEVQLIANVSSLFDGSTDIVFDCSTSYLYLVNTSGIYRVDMLTELGKVKSELVDTTCSALGLGVRIEIVNSSTTRYLLVVRGGESDEFCLISLPSEEVVSRGRLSQVLGGELATISYTVSAIGRDGLEAYFTLLNKSSGKPIIVSYSVETSTWSVISNLSAVNLVSMAYGDGYLWILAEGGPLYRVDISTHSIEPIRNLLLPFYPTGYGDRLEYFSNALLFIRAANTTEIWILPTG